MMIPEVKEKGSFVYDAVVYVVGETYQIVFNTDCHGIAWCLIGRDLYYDETNGLLKSATCVHRISVPMDVLNAAGAYTVFFRSMLDRKPYRPVLGEEIARAYHFRPIDHDRSNHAICLYHISDSHWKTAEPVMAASAYLADTDLLVLNGDIAESDTYEGIMTTFKIASDITRGEIPVVLSRGNHDTRGHMAPELTDYIGTDRGNTYFTFRLGALWGVVLDCGEDKADDCIEYGGVVHCHEFRRRQTKMLEEIVARREFADAGIRYKLAICHVPFSYRFDADGGQFDIENDVYQRWCELLNEIGIDLMLTGHMHQFYIIEPNDARNTRGLWSPVVVGSKFIKSQKDGSNIFVGTRVELSDKGLRVVFNGSDGEIYGSWQNRQS